MPRLPRRCSVMSRSAWRRSNRHAGSSSSASCRRRRPARSSASSCASVRRLPADARLTRRVGLCWVDQSLFAAGLRLGEIRCRVPRSWRRRGRWLGGMRRRSFEFDDGRTRGAEMPPPIALARMPRSSAEGPDAIRLGRQEKLPLSLIVGLTAEAELDLKKIGIDDVEDLAAANPILLLTDTSYAFAQIVDWIGEALLLHYFGSDQAGQLRRFGVRTLLNLLVACDGRPAAAMTRILCRSDDPVALSSLAATLQADPLVTRLSELQNPNASRIVGTIIEAGAAARRLARAGESRLASYDHLLAARDEAYAGLSLRERLHAAHRAVLVAAVLAIFGALAAIW